MLLMLERGLKFLFLLPIDGSTKLNDRFQDNITRELILIFRCEMASVSGYRELKASEISSDSENDYSDIFDESSGDSDNESFSTINSESEDELDNLDDARKWIKLSSVPENISPAPPHGGNLDHLPFRLDFIDNIVEKYQIPSQRHSGGHPSIQGDPIRLMERHFPEYIPKTANQKEPRRRCAVCL